MTSDEEIRLIQFKNQINTLSKLRALPKTSVITLLVPPNDQINKVQNLITTELSTASNVKNRLNRLAIESSLASIQNKLKLYRHTPKNGLIVLSGEVTNGFKDKKITLAIEPPKPILHSLYKCDTNFHLDSLIELCEDNNSPKIGVILVVGSDYLIATLQGLTKETHVDNSFFLTNKTSRGGQSQHRYERLAEETRHKYLVKVGEEAKKYFMDSQKNVPTVKYILLGGNGYLIERFNEKDFLEPRLKDIIMAKVEIQYSGSNGLSEAIMKGSEQISCLKFKEESDTLEKYFTLIGTGKLSVCYGLAFTFQCLYMGSIETLLLSTDANITAKNIKDENIKEKIKNYYKQNAILFEDPETTPINDWLIEEAKNYGTIVKLVSTNLSVGNQFLIGFGGFGGLLRYDVKQEIFDDVEDSNLNDDDFI